MVWFFKKNKNNDKTPQKDDETPQDEVSKDESAEKVEENLKEESPLDALSPDVLTESVAIDALAEAVTPQEELSEEPQETPKEEQAEESVFVEKQSTPEPQAEDEPEESGWLTRLSRGLSKSSSKITDSISSVLTKRKLDDELLEELEDILIMADLGPKTANRLVEKLRSDRFGKDMSDEDVKEFLARSIEDILSPVAKPLEVGGDAKPYVILMTGVNGAGKTTTIGKMGHVLKAQGKKVLMAAGDTFRAAAVEQLTVWGERSDIPVFAKPIGADSAALAYEAYEKAKQEGFDVLIIDTAGRLQNKKNLMEELAKIVRVLKKHDENAPHSALIVLDATTGQNANSQVKVFKETVDISGLVVTKLDGSAKGGVIVSLADEFKLPVHAVGVGEAIEDLKPFKAKDFARSLMGLPHENK